ncbi:MAG: glycosyltransferase [Actinomycetota bacterium]
MRILFLAPALPWPPHTGGTQRIAAIIERLSERHEVFLFALEGDGGTIDSTIAAPLAGLKTVPYPGLPPRSRVGFWSQVLLDPLPKVVRQAVTEAPRAAAVAFARTCKPEAIVAEPIEMQPYLTECAKAFPSARTMLGWIDVVSVNIARQTARESGFGHRLHARREVHRMARLEKDAAHFSPRPGPVNDRQALFVGPLAFAPNRDAVAWFSSEIMPLLDGITLTVAGEPAGFAAPSGVGLAGRVNDVRPMTAHAGVVVVPLRSGSGTRLKILEALAMEKAVVSTTIGAEGLDVRNEEHLLIADDAASFAAAVTRALSDDALRERLGRNGRALVQRLYRWDMTVQAIEQALAGEKQGARA